MNKSSKLLKERSAMFLKGMEHGIELAYTDIRDLLNQRLARIEKSQRR